MIFNYKINNVNIDSIFDQHKNIRNCLPSKKFIHRLENARREEEVKKKKVTYYKRSKSMIMSDLEIQPVFFYINNFLSKWLLTHLS